MGRCLTSARHNMKADVLRQWDTTNAPTTAGYWTSRQDPITLEILRVWVPVDTDTVTAGTQTWSINCEARPITSSGIRALGSAENWGMLYESEEYITLKFSSGDVLSKRDRITNVRNAAGKVIWVEEEAPMVSGAFKPTIFDVKGIVPLIDPFGNHIESMAVLERSDIQ